MIINQREENESTHTHQPPSSWVYELVFDGGRKSCGELILELAGFFKTIPIGTRVCVIAHDEAAWIDIPAWCRVTENGFLAEKTPFYLLQRK
jgi:tRNA 2-thiouridine synthesizing protein A